MVIQPLSCVFYRKKKALSPNMNLCKKWRRKVSKSSVTGLQSKLKCQKCGKSASAFTYLRNIWQRSCLNYN